MEVLRNLFGNLSSGIIRLAVTVGILAAVGFFIVRPVLDTTKTISKEANESFEKNFEQGFGTNGVGLEDVNKTLKEVNKQVQVQIKRSFHVAKVHGTAADPKRMIRCIQRAHGDVNRIQRCARKF